MKLSRETFQKLNKISTELEMNSRDLSKPSATERTQKALQDAGLADKSIEFKQPLHTSWQNAGPFTTTPFQRPVDGPAAKPRNHLGIDMSAPAGTSVYSIGQGTVKQIDNVGTNPMGGNAIYVSHLNGKFVSYYAHLKDVQCKIGDKVDSNTVIGTCGSSGNAKSSHLHFAIYVGGVAVDPATFIGTVKYMAHYPASTQLNSVDGRGENTEIQQAPRLKGVSQKTTTQTPSHVEGFLNRLTNFLSSFTETKAFASLEEDLMVKIADRSPKFAHNDARDALAKAYRKLYGKEPSEGELDFGLSTAFFETGYGRAHGQFARWAAEGKYNWGALETNISGPERTLEKFKNAGLHVTKEKGSDAGRPVYFYLFPNDVEAAQAFLMTWGRPDTLKAAASGSAEAVAKSMKNHNYYEGFWVPPGNPKKYKMPPFKEASSAEEAERNNIRDYASALAGHRAVVTGKSAHRREPAQIAMRPSIPMDMEKFLNRITNFISSLTPSFSSLAQNGTKFLISVGAEDFVTKTEYARILQSVLQEELKITSSIHYADDVVELACSLPFNEYDSNEVLKEVCSAVTNTFEFATKKLGGCKTYTIISPGKTSMYQEMDIKVAEINRRKFKLKIAQG